MIAHMIGGEAKEYHKNLSDVLASAYRLRPVTTQINPHITFKAPFDALSSDLHEAEHVVQKFAQTRSPITYTLKGFGSFGDRVVFMDVEGGDAMKELQEELKEELKQLPWLEFKPHEEETRPHATLCYPRNSAQAQDIVTRLTERGGKQFNCTLDSIALLKKDERRWEVVKEFKLGGSDSALGSVVV